MTQLITTNTAAPTLRPRICRYCNQPCTTTTGAYAVRSRTGGVAAACGPCYAREYGPEAPHGCRPDAPCPVCIAQAAICRHPDTFIEAIRLYNATEQGTVMVRHLCQDCGAVQDVPAPAQASNWQPYQGETPWVPVEDAGVMD